MSSGPAQPVFTPSLPAASMSEAQQAMAESFRHLVAPALAQGRSTLTELEGLELLKIMGIEAPSHVFVHSAAEYEKLTTHDNQDNEEDRVVVKVISPEILHKTERGGVVIVPNTRKAILEAIRAMEDKFTDCLVHGYTVNEFVRYEPKFGHEMLFGYRFTADFGPVVSFGPGGIFTEFLSRKFQNGVANVSFSPRTATRALVEAILKENVVAGITSLGLRNTKPEIPLSTLTDTIMKFLGAADALAAAGISEFEVNPMVIRPALKGAGGNPPTASLLALDCLVTLKDFTSMGLSQRQDGILYNAAQAARPS